MNRQGRPNEPQLVHRRDPETDQPVEGLLRWGLIPHFGEARPDFAPIRARAETIAEMNGSATLIASGVASSQWTTFFKKTAPASGALFLDGEPFGVAGIWENWRNPSAGMWERTLAVITVPANALIAPVHDRMLGYCRLRNFRGSVRKRIRVTYWYRLLQINSESRCNGRAARARERH